ncbi:MAG: ABC transporter ATP-binding protein [Parachlamydiaceae bacterium]|nr:ABC transporter ATP-binding protein [Parachlamydiaceae bacterium]
MLDTKSLSYKKLLHAITLTFVPGRLYGIIGANGSGKTTLLKTMSGIWAPTSGHVFWQNADLLKMERRTISQTLSLVPQNPQVHFDFSVAEMVAMGRYAHYSVQPQDIEEALSAVNALHLKQRPISQLSSGERQRVYIARALITKAPVILLDEPTASLDVRHQEEIWLLLQRLSQQGKVVIMASHDLNAVTRYCTDMIAMQMGLCVAAEPVSFLTPEFLRGLFFDEKSQL